MTTEHPITPPPNLRRLWAQQAQRLDPHDPVAWMEHVSIQAARWGADAELEACCANVHTVYGKGQADWLRTARRPKPPSLAEEGLRILVENSRTFGGRVELDLEDVVTIRVALKRLQELERLHDDQG